MNSFGGFIILVIAAYTIFTALIYFRQESLLFYPMPSVPEIESHYREYSVSFVTDDDNSLHGWIFPASDSDLPTLVFYGGNGQELSGSIDSLRALGDYTYILINYRGYGSSTGIPSEKDLKSDALLILDALQAQGKISLANTFIMGRSLGASIATHVAANRLAKGLILISPFNSAEAIASDLYPFLPVKWLFKHPFSSTLYVDRINIPTMIIKAQSDQVVPHKYSDALIDAWKGPLKVVQLPGTNHNYIETAEYFELVDDFLKEYAQNKEI